MKLIKGVIKNISVEYIEFEENTYYKRTQTIIRKKTSFSVNNEIFHTFENIDIEEGKKEMFYADANNKVTFFGKKQVNQSFIKRSSKKIKDKKEQIKIHGFFNLLLGSFCGLGVYAISLLYQDITVPLTIKVMVLISSFIFFSLFIANYFCFKYSKKELKGIQEKIKKEKDDLSEFKKSLPDAILQNNKEPIEIKNEVLIS